MTVKFTDGKIAEKGGDFMQFRGPEHGCPEPGFPNVDLNAELEQGGIAVGWHEGNPYDSETGLAGKFRVRLEAMLPREKRSLIERHQE